MLEGAYEILSLTLRYWFIALLLAALFLLLRLFLRELRVFRAIGREIERSSRDFTLRLLSDPDRLLVQGSSFPLRGEMLLGSGRGANLRIQNGSLFAQHVLLRAEDGGLSLEPVGNALVAVAGEELDKRGFARAGDELQIGELLFRLEESNPLLNEEHTRRAAREPSFRLPGQDWILLFLCVFEFSGFALLSFYKGFSPLSAALAAAMPLGLVLFSRLSRRFLPHMDQSLLLIGHFLCALGLILLVRLSPERAGKQALFYLAGAALSFLVTALVAKLKSFAFLRWPAILLSLGLLGATLLLGTEKFGAKNWLGVEGFSFQPSEFVKIALILVLSLALSQRRSLPSLLPAGLFAGGCLLLIVLQKDLGAVLICFCVCLFLYYAATGNLGVSLFALLLAGLGALALYFLFDHVQVRVAIWRNPWRSPEGSGYQIVQALVAIASGGMTGLGLGLGSPSVVPLYDTDFIFAAICEEFGLAVALMTLLLYALLFLRASFIASRCQSGFDALVCVGALASLSIQTFLIVGGVIKMIPLTGVTLPFVSYGGSSILSCMILLGVLQGVSVRAGRREEEAYLRAQAPREAAR
ncbi:MAG: FtsW/RodA/SpoVE family cell cycle protein [Christensenellaceae bacterium]|jgi:cell division protein FtsW (lipid II flippase)|nr:FtsW/RodA/SpoVE family cell cycle protein [Christensenellaceae bacterium]